MMDYMEYLNVPATIIAGVVLLLLISNVVGEILELKGKVVPEFMKLRTHFMQKRDDQKRMRRMYDVVDGLEQSVNEINSHYSPESLARRDKWMKSVNDRLDAYDNQIKKIDSKLDTDNDNIVALLIDQKRNAIIDFAANVSCGQYAPVTRERFNRMFKLYHEYEDLIRQNGLTNGEVDIAYKIIVESYQEHMKNQTFIEDVRGWK